MTRRDIGMTVVVAAGCSAVLIALYYVVPVAHRTNSIWWRLAVAFAIFVFVLVHELRAILSDVRPLRRAIIALAILLPLFIVTFAYIYLTMSASDPHAFSDGLTHTGALYFTITTLATVGYGDIVAKTDAARSIVMIQMTADIIFVAVVIRLLFGAASHELNRRSTESAP